MLPHQLVLAPLLTLSVGLAFYQSMPSSVIWTSLAALWAFTLPLSSKE